MKMIAAVATVVAAATACVYTCQPGGRHHQEVLFELFDTNSNGEISFAEIDGAAAILKDLDRNADESLTTDELPRPPRRGERDHQRGGHQDRQRPPMAAADATPGTVVIQGGYQTDHRDGGRPVALIAAALGVPDQVFRDAFSNVSPARFGPPTALRAHANKTVLMDALGPHGITNDRLDEVSNYYRYRPQAGERWPVTPAQARAIIEDGQVTGIEVVDGGSGYLSEPSVRIAGYPDVRVRAAIEFSKDFDLNGRMTGLVIIP